MGPVLVTYKATKGAHTEGQEVIDAGDWFKT